MKTLLCLLLFGLCGCAHIPEGISAVKGFDMHRYLGTWYEIARLDHSLSRLMSAIMPTRSFLLFVAE